MGSQVNIVGITGEPIPEEINRRIRLYALATFLIVALFCIGTAYWQNTQTRELRHAQRAAYGNCLAIQGVVQRSVANLKVSTGLTPQQKVAALATYTKLLSDLDCEGLRP